jgi:hypothetical protein
VNVERTIEFILQCQARAEVRMDRMEARFDKEIAAINRLLRQGAKILAATQREVRATSRQLRELAAAQRATERSLQAFLESLRKGTNGRR